MKKHVAIIQNGFGGPSLLGWTEEARNLDTGAYRVYVNGWRPIEMAPKDGSEIDLWIVDSEKNGHREASCAWKCDYYTSQYAWCYYDFSPMVGEWVAIDGNATHWMPLPEPPEVE